MKKILSLSALSVLMLICWGGQALAIPTLQLDILGGTYDTGSGTIVSNGDIFTLYAYLIEDKDNKVTDTYFISAALTPQEDSAANLGSFSFAATPISVTSGMVYGTPPLNALYPDLGPHGIFDTYYKEFSFSFNTANTAAPSNSQDSPGVGPQAGTGMYYAAFAVDTSLLAAGYEMHFDLYNENIKKNGGYDTQFAPFSHDAESHGNNTPVPEPATMLLVGTGLIGLANARRRQSA